MPSYSFHSSYSKRGFTIAELFICVIIVFVVALVLFPVFAQPKSHHNHWSGASNQKQIALGFLQYIQDYDERFPPAVGYGERPSLSGDSSLRTYARSWGPQRILPSGEPLDGIIYPYMKLFLDPESDAKGKDGWILDYMYNDLLVGQRTADIRSAEHTVRTINAENRLANVGHAYTPNSVRTMLRSMRGAVVTPDRAQAIRTARTRHSGGANLSFTDGHVKWFQGGDGDLIFFPPRESASVSSLDPQTKRQIGPKPGGSMTFQGRQYAGTFHIR